MIDLLLKIKKHFRFLWQIIEWGNGIVFSILFRGRSRSVSGKLLKETSSPDFEYRELQKEDMQELHALIQAQDPADLTYFKPHEFDLKSLIKQKNKPAFLMMGVYRGEHMVGYFFLRFFSNRKCFVGRLIDREYRGQGIGQAMNHIMYETAWQMGFRCLSTISRKNKAVMHAHAKNPDMKVIKELQDDYLFVEFIRKQ